MGGTTEHRLRQRVCEPLVTRNIQRKGDVLMQGRWSEGWSEFNRASADPMDVLIRNVRQESAAGWYVGALQFFSEEEAVPYSRDSEYYGGEHSLHAEYPNTISVKEAFQQAKSHPIYQKKLQRARQGGSTC